MAEVNIESAKEECHLVSGSSRDIRKEEYENDSEASFSKTVPRHVGGSEVSDDGYSISGGPDDESYSEETKSYERILRKILANAQQFFLFLCWVTFTYFLMANDEAVHETVTLSVPQGEEGLKYTFSKAVSDTSLCLRIYGPFMKTSFRFDELQSVHLEAPHLLVTLYKVNADGESKKIGTFLHLHLAHHESWEKPKMEVVEKILENINSAAGQCMLHIQCHNCERTIAVQLDYGFTMISKKSGLILAMFLLLLLYLHIMFEHVHRTLAGVICCTLGVGIIAAVHLRPPLQVIFNEWGNVNTIMLFFGVSIIVEILAETGLQDHLAAVTYELAHGHIWPMLHIVLMTTCILSNIFNEIFLVLLIAPICLRLCEIMNLNCTPVLSCFILAINVGATLTPMSSLSNTLIANSPLIANEPIGFGEFTIHMFPAMVLTLAQSYLHLRLLYFDSDKMRSTEPPQVRRLKHLIRLWRSASHKMGGYTLDDSYANKTVRKRIVSLRKRLQRLGRMPERPSGFEERVQNLRNNFPITHIPVLVICLLGLFVTLLFSMFSAIPDFVSVSSSWIAILVALLVLSLTCYEDIEGVMTRIDWATMLFFVTLSIVMQVLISLGLLENVGFLLEHLIVNVPQQYRLMVAILSIIWISAILATFIDNVPVADMMLRIIATLAVNQNMKIPIMPMVWSLALGCTLGGNGSIVGAFANIACAGVANRHGFSLTFFGYFQIGFLVMIGNILISSAYLLLAHVIFEWH